MPSYCLEEEELGLGVFPVAGVDEAGRGPLAGPVIAAAVILPRHWKNREVDDSKKLTEKKRHIIFSELVSESSEVDWGIGLVDQVEIDRVNILNATHRAMKLAIDALRNPPGIALIDGLPVKGLKVPHRAIVKGDGISISIAAASVIAKVSRDQIMIEYAKEFPVYGFEKHKGYGTKQHLEALRKYGPCRLHRRSFQPISQMPLPL